MAAGGGNADAAFNLGLLRETSKDFNQRKQAVEWYTVAAQLGSGEAANNLGCLHANGELVAKDPGKAFKWFKRAGALGDKMGLWNLAQCYENGDGTRRNSARALEAYVFAAIKGHTNAKRIVVEYQRGLAFKQRKNNQKLSPKGGKTLSKLF